ncbi:DUF5988 family protein [Streptomyces sp. NPDC005808]|uniref:DUF5988 family protein n=1 Tax=Streptomyces sp. NPDC005808 TaxID=3364734 RepID=UPI00367D3416
MAHVIAISAVTAKDPVRLEGGPVDLSGTVNLADCHEVIYSDEKIKIRYGNGYEHYTPLDTTVEAGTGIGPGPMTFRWVGRTKIAE